MESGPKSCGHWSVAPRPGCECSKISCSRVRMENLWPVSSPSVLCEPRGPPVRCMPGALQTLTERRDVAVDVGRGLGLRRAHEQRRPKLGVVFGQIETAEDV